MNLRQVFLFRTAFFVFLFTFSAVSKAAEGFLKNNKPVRSSIDFSALQMEQQISPPDTAQKHKFEIGVDLGKTIYANLERGNPFGFTSEVLIRWQFNKGFNFFLASGYSTFNRNSIYANTYYRGKGYFGKGGIEFHLFETGIGDNYTKIGFYYVSSFFADAGYFKIPGDYYSSYRQNFSRNRVAHSMQLSFSQPIYEYKKFRLDGQFGAAYIFSHIPKDSSKGISYYTPGAGLSGRLPFSANLTFQIYYIIR